MKLGIGQLYDSREIESALLELKTGQRVCHLITCVDWVIAPFTPEIEIFSDRGFKPRVVKNCFDTKLACEPQSNNMRASLGMFLLSLKCTMAVESITYLLSEPFVWMTTVDVASVREVSLWFSSRLWNSEWAGTWSRVLCFPLQDLQLPAVHLLAECCRTQTINSQTSIANFWLSARNR